MSWWCCWSSSGGAGRAAKLQPTASTATVSIYKATLPSIATLTETKASNSNTTAATRAPTSATAVSSMSNLMTTGGDLIYGGASGTPTRLANGSSGNILTSAGGTSAPAWTAVTAINGTITNGASAAYRAEYAYITNGSSAACNGSPCTVARSSSSWISSVTRSGTGQYTVNITGSVFSAAPSCVCTARRNATGGSGECRFTGSDTAVTTSVATIVVADGGADLLFDIVCYGPR